VKLFAIIAAIFILFSSNLVHCYQNEETPMPERLTKSYIAKFGSTYESVIEMLGSPDIVDRFQMASGLKEFRIELLNFFKSEDLGHDAPFIREATWRVSDDENYTIWFVEKADEALVVDSFRWSPDTEF
jgi:hypothetical protein